MAEVIVAKRGLKKIRSKKGNGINFTYGEGLFYVDNADVEDSNHPMCTGFRIDDTKQEFVREDGTKAYTYNFLGLAFDEKLDKLERAAYLNEKLAEMDVDKLKENEEFLASL